MLMSFFGALGSGPLVGGDEVVEDHQQEQGHAQEVGEQSQLDVGNHYEVWKMERELFIKILVLDNNKLQMANGRQ